MSPAGASPAPTAVAPSLAARSKPSSTTSTGRCCATGWPRRTPRTWPRTSSWSTWRRWADFDRGRPLRPWLAGIAFKVASEHLKRRRRWEPRAWLDPPDHAPGGEELLAAARARALAMRCLAALDERQRALIVLHDLDGLPDARDRRHVVGAAVHRLQPAACGPAGVQRRGRRVRLRAAGTVRAAVCRRAAAACPARPRARRRRPRRPTCAAGRWRGCARWLLLSPGGQRPGRLPIARRPLAARGGCRPPR